MHLEPELFRLDAQHFQDPDGHPVQQILFSEVEADGTGIALCTTQMAKHFLESPKSISMQGLALLTIDTPPPAMISAAGLSPIVFPALCTTTDEHTIIMGHIMQLGDAQITRKMAGAESAPEKVDTQVIKFQIFRDQLELDWSEFSKAPVRNLINSMEALQLCRGQQCGVDCAKHHPNVDETLDTVVMEVWARAFMAHDGKRTEPSQSQIFTVFIRIPLSALDKILLTSPAGVYGEPRGAQPREQDDKYRVVWLPGVPYTEALHHCRTFAKAVCLVRLRQKYGIRVRKADEAMAWAKLRPGIEFVDMSIQKIYELFPIPHGTQRQAIAQILGDWGWKARALQPGRGNSHHMAWKVGSDTPPPAPILTAFGADVIITAVKDLKHPEPQPKIYATVKTQKLLRDQPAGSTEARSHAGGDPWIENDPWSGYSKKIPSPAPVQRTHRDEVQTQMRTDIRAIVQEELQGKQDEMTDGPGDIYTTETEQRMCALESGFTELQKQNGQFLQWFQQTGERLNQNEALLQEVQTTVQQHAGNIQQISTTVGNTEKAIGEVHSTLNAHQQELHSIGSNFQSAFRTMKDELSGEMMASFNQQYGKLEALLEKRHKSN